MQLIQLTDLSDRPVFVNPEHVRYVRDDNRGGTKISFSEGDSFSVKEDVNTVLQRLRSAH